jgi:serine/threonine protein kinase
MNAPESPMKTCKQCGQPMASNAAEGLCARCLLSVVVKEPAPTGGAPDFPDIGDAAEIARRFPQFEIIDLLGRGGMGVVYKARQINLDRLVALKILPPLEAMTPDFVERFRREARSLAKLSHPNIVGVHDFGESGGLYYFAMEFVDGVNLREMIRSGKMKPEEALAVVPKICDALQFAHEEGVVHRDVKPENILIDKRGRVKIADFGLAKLLRREQADHTLTVTGMTLGTPRYMAPEQLDKPETVDHRADIYSLGVVFYEMLTGEVPMGRFAPPSEKVQIDVRLDEIVLHALERDVERRYQHASQVRDDVEKVTSKPVPVAAPVPAPKPKPTTDSTLHPKIATARQMSFGRWLWRWKFATSPAPGEWQAVTRPTANLALLLGAVAGADVARFAQSSPFIGELVKRGLVDVLILSVIVVSFVIWRARILWSKYRREDFAAPPARIPYRDIPADIRHGMWLRRLGAVLGLAAVVWLVNIALGPFTTVTFESTTNYDLTPHSKQFEKVTLTPEFESFNSFGRTYHRRPAVWHLGL